MHSTMQPEYDAFISYSRRDTGFAATLERALEAYTPPAGTGRERRPLVVFRDEQDLTGSGYDEAIQSHLSRSRKLIVVCSPAARASGYVNDEIRRFAALHGSENIVPVLLSGVPNNAAAEGETEELAFPEALCELLQMPLAVSYAGFVAGRDRVNRRVFYGAWYTLLANLLDTSRAEIEERDRRRRARTRNAWIGGGTAVVVGLALLTVWALVERSTALQRLRVMMAGRMAAEARVEQGLEPGAVERRTLLAVEAVRRLQELGEPIHDAVTTLRDASALLPRRVLRLGPGQRDFAFSGDGLFAFTAGAGGVSVHSLRTGTRLATLGSVRPVDALFTSADGRWLGAVDDAGRIVLWTAPGWRPRPAAPAAGGERAVCGALTPDGRYLAVLALDGSDPRLARARVWRTDTLRLVAERRIGLSEAGVLRPDRGECLSVDDEHLFARYRPSSAPGTLSALVWRWRPPGEAYPGLPSWLNTGNDLQLFLHWSGLLDAVISPASKAIFLGREGGEVSRVELPSGREATDQGLDRLIPTTDRLAEIGSGGTLLVSYRRTEDPYVPLLKYQLITVTDRVTRSPLGVVAETGGDFWLTRQGENLVTANGRRVRLWRTRDGRELVRIPATDPVHRVYTAPSGRYVATGGARGTIEVWDVANPAEELRAPRGRVVDMSADARRLAVGTDLGVLVLDRRSGASVDSRPLGGGAALVRLSSNGRLLAVASGEPSGFNVFREDLRTLLVDLEGGTERMLAARSATAAEFSPDGSALLLGEIDGMLRLVRTSDGSTIWEKRLGAGPVSGCVFSADGRIVAVGLGRGGGAAVAVLATATGVGLMRVESRSSGSAALSADGKQLATAGGGAVEVVRVPGGEVVRRLELPQSLNTLRHAAFLADGTRLLAVAGSQASTFLGASFFTEQAVFLWDLDTGRLVRRLPEAEDARDYQASLGEEEKPYFAEVAWTRDGRYVAAQVFPSRLNYWAVPGELSYDELRVWEMGGAAPEEIFRTTAEATETLLGVGAGAIVFTRGNGLRAWNTRVDGLLEEACLRLRRNPSRTEWRSLVGRDEPFRAPCPRLPVSPDAIAPPA